MKYFQIKATLKKDGLIGDEVDTTEGRKKLYAKVHRIKEKLGKGRLLFLVRKQYYSNLLIRYFSKGSHQKTIAELEDFIEVNSEEPANENTPYIVKSVLVRPEDSPSNDLYVNMIVTSQTIINRLLKRPVRHHIHVDFTYEVSVGGLMVLQLGTNNDSHEYLPNRENETAVRDVFQWLKTEIDGSVEFVMADGARAFSNAIYAEFEKAVRLMCYAHVCR